MSVKTQRKANVKPAYKISASKKARSSAPKTLSRPNGKDSLAAYEQLHVGIVQASPDGKYIDANKEFCRILGYSKKELLRLSVRACTPEEDYRLDMKLHQQLVDGKIPFYGLEKRYIRKDGEIVWVELTRSLVRDAEGKPLYTVGVVTDISAHKHVERVLRESVESLRLATESARMFKWELDLQKQLYTFSDNFEHVLGFSAGLLPQGSLESVLRLCPREDAQAVSEAFAKAVETQSDLKSQQFRLINPETGQIVWLEMNAKITCDDQGNPQRLLGVAQNIDASKKAQEQIQIVSRMPAENPNPVMRLTPDGKILYANDASAPLLAAWRQEVEQRIPDELQRAVTAACIAGVKTEVEIEHRGKDFSFTLVPILESGYVNLYGKDITGRKQAEKALLLKESELQEIINRTPFMLTRCTRDLRYRFVSQGYARLIGRRPEEVEGRPILEIMGQEGLKTISPYIDKVLQGNRVEYEEEVSFRGAGAPSLHVVYTPDRDEHGNVIGWFASIVDITERKRVERALAEFARQQEALYRLSDELHHTNSLEDVYNAALNAILSGLRCDRASILLFDETGVMRFVAWRGLSDRYRKATEGHSPWTADEKNPYPICVGEIGTSDLGDALKATIQEEGIRSLAFIPLLLNGKLIGKFMAYFDGLHDCSDVEIELSLMIARQLAFGIDRKRAEAELRESEERYRTIVDTASEGIWYIDLNATTLYLNEPMASMLGCSVAEVLGRKVPEFCFDEDVPKVQARIASNYQGNFENFDFRFRCKDGSEVLVLASTSPVHDAAGNVIGAFGMFVDITERKRAEEQLRASEALYRTIARSIPGGGVYVVDKDFRYRVAEGSISEAFGLTREMLEGHTISEIFPGELGAGLKERLQQTFAGETISFETRRNGHIYWTQLAPLRDSIGQAIVLTLDITERKQAEEALRIENERFMRFVNSNIVGILIGDASGKVILANDYYLQLLGVSRQDFTEEKVDWKKFTPPEWLPADEKAIRELQERGVCDPYEKEYVRADGTRVPVYIADAMLPGPRAEIAAFVLDITERRRAEEALKQSEERFARFMQHLPGLAWIKDIEGRYVYANAAAEKTFHTPREKLYGKTDAEIFPPETAAEFRRNDQQALLNEKGMQTIETLRQEDDIFHYSLVSKFPIPGPDGKPALIGGTAFDVTERLQAEEALKKSVGALYESEERFKAILRQATAGIVRKDLDGRFIFVNQAFCNMLGYTESELLGKTFWQFTYHEDIAENKRLYDRMMLEGVPFKLEKRIIRKDHSLIWVDVSVSPVMDSDGRPQSAVAVEVDITGRKQAEEALQQLNLQLESRVQKRTATIQAINQSLREEIAERKRIEEALRASEAIARESEEKLRTLFDLLPVGISFLDPEGNVLQTNSALLNILKLSKEQLFSQVYKFRRYIRADGTSMPLTEFASVRALAENKTVYNVETGITLENGELIWTSISAAPVDVADVGVVVVTVDVTDSKRAEQALQESHRRLRILSQRLVEVQEEERRALARELHDRVGQTLAALNINLIIINGQLSTDVVQQIGARLNDSMKLVAETIALVRDVMTDLRPAVLDDYGLEAALESQLSKFTARYNIQTVFEKPNRPIPRLGASVEMTFLRIAQEALMNIARHAHAEHVSLALRREEQAVWLAIQDDGIGIESWQDANRPGSHGLTIMRERAEAFGGTLRVKSVPNQGTLVEVSIPLKNDDQDRAQKENL